MKNFLYLVILIIPVLSAPGFIDEQKKFETVRRAFKDKGSMVNANLEKHRIPLKELNILIVAYKAEDLLEVYGKAKAGLTYKKIAAYKVCSKSGIPGPKRKSGDLQVPEGFYKIDRFNPASNFYLSLGINYPNAADRIKSKAPDLGGDIFIHGSCVTIGCLPMTDDLVKEIYIYAIQARDNGQTEIPVYIFPFKMTTGNMERNKPLNAGNKELEQFWINIKSGYDQFTASSKALNYSVSAKGDYVFK